MGVILALSVYFQKVLYLYEIILQYQATLGVQNILGYSYELQCNVVLSEEKKRKKHSNLPEFAKR